MINSWNELTIQKFYELEQYLQLENESDRVVGIVSLVTGKPISEIEELNVLDILKLKRSITWIAEEPKYNKKPKKKIELPDFGTCELVLNPTKMSIAQYIDFQTVYNNLDENIEQILSIFAVPKGKKYGEGYDIAEFSQSIRNNVDIITAKEAVFFILRRFNKSTCNTLTYLISKKQATKLITMNKAKKAIITEQINSLKATKNLLHKTIAIIGSVV